jgi:dihydrofolate reductase
MATFKGIMAMAKNRVIGKDKVLPWPMIKADMKFFRETTWDKQLIMGRKSYEGMPNGFLNRRVIWVLTKENKNGWLQMDFNDGKGRAYGVNIVTNVNDLPDMEYIVCGGAEIYKLFLPKINEFLVTHINQEYGGDTVMPEFENQFQKQSVVMEQPEFKIIKYERTTT